ncbi:hypothetical protein GCM10027299_13030 [Larkinella ripae]
MDKDRILLLVNMVDGEKQPQEITCALPNEEDAFDVISFLAMDNNQLQVAYLMDRENSNHVISLPVEAFNGECFSKPIKRLQKEWQRLLGLPAHPASVSIPWLISLTQRRLRFYERRIALLGKMIERIEVMRIRSEKIADTFRRNVLINQNQSMLTLYQQQLVRAKTALESVKNRLAFLKAER